MSPDHRPSGRRRESRTARHHLIRSLSLVLSVSPTRSVGIPCVGVRGLRSLGPWTAIVLTTPSGLQGGASVTLRIRALKLQRPLYRIL